MFASKPITGTSIPVSANWLESFSAMSLAGMRKHQRMIRAVTEANAKAAEDYADYLRRLCLAENPMTAWACHDEWIRGSWQRAVDRAGIVTAAMK